MQNLSRSIQAVVALLIVTAGLVPAAAAQTIGPVSWQLQPYCNVVTLSATVVGATYRLEGFDDQCGAATQASVIGTAFLNPNGTIGLGLNIVATPGGPPVHVDATVTAPGFSGLWQDSGGGSGTFVFGAGVAGFPARAVGATGPSVTTVVAGAGLVGGGSASTVNLAVSFAASGDAPTLAHSDHTHTIGTANVVVGDGALASNTTGQYNTALGVNALASSPTANGNVAVGTDALFSANTPGSGGNVAVGTSALFSTTSGCCNVALGSQASRQNTGGHRNVAIGLRALQLLTTGFSNVAIGRNALSAVGGNSNNNIGIGHNAGANLAGGSENIFIGNNGIAADNLAIRIGREQTQTFIAGVNGGMLDALTDLPVNVDQFGQVGTTVSSARFKTDIANVDVDRGFLHHLRPVSFRYLPVETRGARRQFGLIAEEVAGVMPELVVNDANGEPYTVRYQLLPPLLLAEIQRLERARHERDERLAEQDRELASLRALVRTLLDARR
jgi:hypothetical protein